MKFKVGDRVQVIPRNEMRQIPNIRGGLVSTMEDYAKQVVTISECLTLDDKGRNGYHIEEDNGRWGFTWDERLLTQEPKAILKTGMRVFVGATTFPFIALRDTYREDLLVYPPHDWLRLEKYNANLEFTPDSMWDIECIQEPTFHHGNIFEYLDDEKDSSQWKTVWEREEESIDKSVNEILELALPIDITSLYSKDGPDFTKEECLYLHKRLWNTIAEYGCNKEEALKIMGIHYPSLIKDFCFICQCHTNNNNPCSQTGECLLQWSETCHETCYGPNTLYRLWGELDPEDEEARKLAKTIANLPVNADVWKNFK